MRTTRTVPRIFHGIRASHTVSWFPLLASTEDILKINRSCPLKTFCDNPLVIIYQGTDLIACYVRLKYSLPGSRP